MIKLIVTIIATLYPLFSCGQKAYYTPVKLEIIQNIHLDSLGTPDDMLGDNSLNAAVYRIGQKAYLVKKNGSSYRAWLLPHNAHINRMTVHEFNGGWPELIVQWQFTNGQSGWGGGTSEQSGVVEIYDLENSKIILSFDNYHNSETWSNQYLNLTGDSLAPKDEHEHIYSTSERYCEEFRLSFHDSLIDISPVYDNKCDGTAKTDESVEPWSLVWRNDAFYLSN